MKKVNLGGFVLISLTVIVCIFYSCKKTEDAPKQEFLEEPKIDVNYDYFAKHGVNSDLATLGRVLFYDRKLSTNSEISCGSCHKQEFAFSDNVQFSKGFNGEKLKRNSPSIQGIKGFINSTSFSNGTFQITGGFPSENNQADVLLFWDGRQKNVSDMVLNPVLNHKEMNIPDFATLVNKINNTSYYPALFAKAFGDATVTTKRIAFAIQGFMACLNTTTANPSNQTDPKINTFFEPSFVSHNGGFPLNTSTLTGIEEEGRILFHTKYNCAKCHDSDPSNPGEYGAVTSPQAMFNIGLEQVYSDKGLGNITGKAGDQGLFKVPTLKNISLTAPYMHDGRFPTLGEVIDHYSHNIQPNENLSPLFRGFDGKPKKLNISPVEKKALIAFLNTLKDEDFLTSPMYSDPFKK